MCPMPGMPGNLRSIRYAGIKIGVESHALILFPKQILNLHLTEYNFLMTALYGDPEAGH